MKDYFMASSGLISGIDAPSGSSAQVFGSISAQLSAAHPAALWQGPG